MTPMLKEGWSQRVKRLVLGALGFALLVLAARTFEPLRSSAEPGALTSRSPGRPLGTLEGVEYHIVVEASPNGPRYTVLAADGEALASDLSEQEVNRLFPAIDLSTMTADVPDSSHPLDR